MFHRKQQSAFDPDQAPPKPCPQMRGLLSALVDDRLHGIARWYAEHHTAGCPHCSATLTSLRILRDRLRALGIPEPEEMPETLSALRRAALENALAEMDGKLP